MEEEREKEIDQESQDVRHGEVNEDTVKRDHVDSILAVGDSIEAQYKQGYKWFPGTIAAVSKRAFKTTYDVKYDDGDFESGVYEEYIRAVSRSDENNSALRRSSPTKSSFMSV